MVARDPQAGEARLGTQFIERNRATLREFEVEMHVNYEGRQVDLSITSGSKVGAFPLISPTSGRADFGVVIAPRFGWSGLGATLQQTGWKRLPELLSLPLLPTSERRVPPWVLSTVVLLRLDALVRQVRRAFTMHDEDLLAPRGAIRWSAYASTAVPTARFLDVPCRFPELESDRNLRGAIHWVLLHQIASLEGQRNGGGAVVLALVDISARLLRAVSDVAPRRPSDADFRLWRGGRLATDSWLNGIEAMEWTVDERGLAGLADLQGLPWRLSMDEFFESWVETVAQTLATRIGGAVASGRERQTLAPLNWEPAFAGSQRYLLPDVVLRQSAEHVIVFDAKYKEHWQEIGERAWSSQSGDLRERHREDLLQVLAYSTLFPESRITCCLAYPCRVETWERMKQRNMLVHRASLGLGHRDVTLILCAMPFGLAPTEIVDQLVPAWR